MTVTPNQFMADPVKTYLSLFIGQSITVVKADGTELTGTLDIMSSNAFVLTVSSDSYVFYLCWSKGVKVDDLSDPTTLTVYL